MWATPPTHEGEEGGFTVHVKISSPANVQHGKLPHDPLAVYKSGIEHILGIVSIIRASCVI